MKSKVNARNIELLSNHYQKLFGPNPLSQTRVRTVTIPRQCLLFILRHKYRVPYGELARLTGKKNHATVIHAERKVLAAMDVRDREYVDSINRWAVVFQEVIPEDADQMWSLDDRIRAMLDQSMLSDNAKLKILRSLLKTYGEDVVK